MASSGVLVSLNPQRTPPGKELFRQLGVGWVGMLRFQFQLACGLAGRPF